MKLLFKFFSGVLFFGTYFIPLFSFEKAFRILRVNTNDYFGIYRDGILTFSTLAIGLSILFLWISPKLFHKPLFKTGIIIAYVGFYYFACISIAWDYRIIFGTTWQWSEIFPELVRPEWYFYVFGVLGLICNYQFLSLIHKKTIQNTNHTRLK